MWKGDGHAPRRRATSTCVAPLLAAFMVAALLDGELCAGAHLTQFSDEVVHEQAQALRDTSESHWGLRHSSAQEAAAEVDGAAPHPRLRASLKDEAAQAARFLATHQDGAPVVAQPPSSTQDFSASQMVDPTTASQGSDNEEDVAESSALDSPSEQDVRGDEGMDEMDSALAMQDSDSFADQVQRWDQGTLSSDTHMVPEEQTMPMSVSAESAAEATADPGTAAPSSESVVPIAKQGDRPAQQHMLRTVQHEMAAAVPESKARVGEYSKNSKHSLDSDVPEGNGVPEAASDVQAGEGGEAPDTEVAPDVATPIPEGSAGEHAVQESADMAQTAADGAECTDAAACEVEARNHVQAAGEALNSKQKDSAHEAMWDKRINAEKAAAVAATVRARDLSQQEGGMEGSGHMQYTLAKAQGVERDEKSDQAQSHSFKANVAKESTAKQTQRLSAMHVSASAAAIAAQKADHAAKVQKAAAIRAQAVAEEDKTTANRLAAEHERSAANRAFGKAHEATEKAKQKRSDMNDLATTLEAQKQKAAKDAMCKQGQKMALELCSVSFKSTSDTCNNAENASLDKELVMACMQKANKDLGVCRALANKHQSECEELATAQVYGDSIPGYEVRMDAAISIDQFSEEADHQLRQSVAARCGVAAEDVITLGVKAGQHIEITLAVAGREAQLKDKVDSLLSALSSGEAVGGIQVTDVAARYKERLQLPGQKPVGWVSEKAEKAWSLSQAETQKLAGMPSSADAQEVNEKAHAHELHSKRMLALAKTKEAKLKKQSIEMSTKVAAKEAQRREEEAVQRAEEGQMGITPGTSGSTPSGSSRESLQGSDPPTVEGKGDFTVIRLRFWKATASWLQAHYPGLWESLDQAMKAGNDTGDQFWMRFLLNWFYTKEREKLGYRYTWKDDGSYNTVRHLVLGCRKYLGEMQVGEESWETGPTTPAGDCKGSQGRGVYSVSIRSVNNLCYPGVAEDAAASNVPAGGSPQAGIITTRAQACRTSTPVSVRLSRFRLVKPQRTASSGMQTGTNGAPAMYLLRAYRAVTPVKFARTLKQFADEENEALVGVQRVRWSVDMVVEYCDVPGEDGMAVPYDEEHSWPRKLHETGKLKWLPITVSDRQKENSDTTLTIMMLQTQDKRLGITCRTPQVAGVVNGKFLTPVDTKCDIKVSHWPYQLNCPPGKKRGLAVQTSVMSRYDDATTPTTSADGESNTVNINSHKMTLNFQNTANLRVLRADGTWANKGSVYVRMKVSEPHWTPSEQFQSHRHYSFSFAMKDMEQIPNSELVWDPQLTSNFQPQKPVHHLDLDHAAGSLQAQPKITVSSFLGLTEPESMTSASAGNSMCCMVTVVALIVMNLLFSSFS